MILLDVDVSGAFDTVYRVFWTLCLKSTAVVAPWSRSLLLRCNVCVTTVPRLSGFAAVKVVDRIGTTMLVS